MRNKCIIEGCDKPNDSFGLCQMHHRRKISNGDPNIVRKNKFHKINCDYENCDRKYKIRGYCIVHYLYIQRKIVIWHYSGGTMKCACCGESLFEGLSVDHEKGGGNKHRNEIKKYGNLIYWLIRNNLPKGFQILCATCNQAKGSKDKCPHNP